jgi:hypothetical protein
VIRRFVIALTLAVAALLSPIAAGTASADTLAERNAYISCVAPGTEVGYSLRIKLLSAGYRALEGLRAGVPYSDIVVVLKREYGFTSTEAWTVLSCAKKTWY